jgi:hypothetical protein
MGNPIQYPTIRHFFKNDNSVLRENAILNKNGRIVGEKTNAIKKLNGDIRITAYKIRISAKGSDGKTENFSDITVRIPNGAVVDHLVTQLLQRAPVGRRIHMTPEEAAGVGFEAARLQEKFDKDNDIKSLGRSAHTCSYQAMTIDRRYNIEVSDDIALLEQNINNDLILLESEVRSKIATKDQKGLLKEVRGFRKSADECIKNNESYKLETIYKEMLDLCYNYREDTEDNKLFMTKSSAVFKIAAKRDYLEHKTIRVNEKINKAIQKLDDNKKKDPIEVKKVYDAHPYEASDDIETSVQAYIEGNLFGILYEDPKKLVNDDNKNINDRPFMPNNIDDNSDASSEMSVSDIESNPTRVRKIISLKPIGDEKQASDVQVIPEIKGNLANPIIGSRLAQIYFQAINILDEAFVKDVDNEEYNEARDQLTVYYGSANNDFGGTFTTQALMEDINNINELTKGIYQSRLTDLVTEVVAPQIVRDNLEGNETREEVEQYENLEINVKNNYTMKQALNILNVMKNYVVASKEENESKTDFLIEINRSIAKANHAIENKEFMDMAKWTDFGSLASKNKDRIDTLTNKEVDEIDGDSKQTGDDVSDVIQRQNEISEDQDNDNILDQIVPNLQIIS